MFVAQRSTVTSILIGSNRIAGWPALALVVMACGGCEHAPRDPEDRVGGDAGRGGSVPASGGAAGSTSDSGGADVSAADGAAGAASGNGGVTAGGAAGAASGNGGVTAGGAPQVADVPEAEVGKEYLLDFSGGGEQAPLHLRVLSTREAEVMTPFGVPWVQSFSRSEGAPLASTSTSSGGGGTGGTSSSPPLLSGSYLFGVPAALALSESPTGGIGTEALFLDSMTKGTCLQPPVVSYNVSSGTVQVDSTPTEVRLAAGDASSVAPPWASTWLATSKPVQAPLSDALGATIDGNVAELDWKQGDPSLASVGAGFTLRDWASAVGRTLLLSGSVASTNGVASPVSLELPILDFGPLRGEKLDFSSALPAELSVPRGRVTHLAPGSDDACPAGCAHLESGTTLAVRLAGAGSALRLTATIKGERPHHTWVVNVDVARSDAAETAPQARPRSRLLHRTTYPREKAQAMCSSSSRFRPATSILKTTRTAAKTSPSRSTWKASSSFRYLTEPRPEARGHPLHGNFPRGISHGLSNPRRLQPWRSRNERAGALPRFKCGNGS
jgi:hypothetical protein